MQNSGIDLSTNTNLLSNNDIFVVPEFLFAGMVFSYQKPCPIQVLSHPAPTSRFATPEISVVLYLQMFPSSEHTHALAHFFHECVCMCMPQTNYTLRLIICHPD